MSRGRCSPNPDRCCGPPFVVSLNSLDPPCGPVAFGFCWAACVAWNVTIHGAGPWHYGVPVDERLALPLTSTSLESNVPYLRVPRSVCAIADRDIGESQTPELGPEWRFDIAYNSALQSATAALAAAGFHAERQNKHMRTFACLEFTVGSSQSQVDFFDACRRKRRRTVYEQVGAISDQEANEMIEASKRLRNQVEQRISQEHPELLS